MNRRIHELAIAASRGERTPPVLMITGGVGRGKSFTARVIARWAQLRNARQTAPCGRCDGAGRIPMPRPSRIFPRVYGACECLSRRPFTVEHVRAYRVGDPAHSLLTIFTLSEGFDDRADAARKRIADLLACSLLIIDDLGSERNPPPTFEPALSSLVDQRTDARKPTWVITNNTPDEIANRYGARNYSRLVNVAETVTLAGRDRRKRVA